MFNFHIPGESRKFPDWLKKTTLPRCTLDCCWNRSFEHLYYYFKEQFLLCCNLFSSKENIKKIKIALYIRFDSPICIEDVTVQLAIFFNNQVLLDLGEAETISLIVSYLILLSDRLQARGATSDRAKNARTACSVHLQNAVVTI